jgi:glyoxylase-like metal-dependent hydrolase (beta-lactamase superfamily II)
MSLPDPGENQAYCDVSALEAGMLKLPLEVVLEGVQGAVTVPSLAFLVRHTTSGKSIVFDLGIRRDWEQYPPLVAELLKDRFTTDVPQTVVESLEKGGFDISSLDYVVYSHLHWGWL